MKFNLDMLQKIKWRQVATRIDAVDPLRIFMAFALVWIGWRMLQPEPPAPYTFSGATLAKYDPLNNPVCVGGNVNYPLKFSISPPSGKAVTVKWNTSWHRLDGDGLVGSSGERIWVYATSKAFDFGIRGAKLPEGVTAGTWELVAADAVSGVGYRVAPIEVVDC